MCDVLEGEPALIQWRGTTEKGCCDCGLVLLKSPPLAEDIRCVSRNVRDKQKHSKPEKIALKRHHRPKFAFPGRYTNGHPTAKAIGNELERIEQVA
jgi:hypothetical protein